MRSAFPTSQELRAGVVAAAVGGAPSSIHALATGRDVLAATEAAGSLIVGESRSRRDRLLAAIPVHLSLSLVWALVLARLLPRRARTSTGALAGVCIGLFDLEVVGRRVPRIRELPFIPQLVDHALFGAVVGRLTRSGH